MAYEKLNEEKEEKTQKTYISNISKHFNLYLEAFGYLPMFSNSFLRSSHFLSSVGFTTHHRTTISATYKKERPFNQNIIIIIISTKGATPEIWGRKGIGNYIDPSAYLVLV